MSRLDENPSRRLFLVSFVSLFLELALIRWVSTEIRIFAYVNNLVLLACFLGLGLGCTLPQPRASLTATALSLGALIGLISLPLAIPLHGALRHPLRDTPIMLSAFTDMHIWHRYWSTNLWLDIAIGLGSTALVFGLIALAFIPLGRMTAGLLEGSANRITAYSVNVAAGLLGIWTLNALSCWWLPPWVWFAVAAVGLWLLIPPSTMPRVSLGLLGLAIGYLALSPRLAKRPIIWSSYQKLEIIPARAGMNRVYLVAVNNTFYMGLLDLSRKGLQGLPIFVDPAGASFSQYDVPYRFLDRAPQAALIVGAGGGNDVAGALRHGARRVTAVEIDPGIYDIGRRLHPEAPYADSRVTVRLTDARAAFRRITAPYDLVIFGLLDAHAPSSSYNNTRLDHYVYTEESFREDSGLLTAEGVITVIFDDAHRPFIGARIAGLLHRVFGEEPIAFRVLGNGWFGPGGVVFVASRDMPRLREVLQRDQPLAQFIERRQVRWKQPVTLTTDNWPYLYLDRPRIPALHLCLSGILLGLLAVGRRWVLPVRQPINWHFFFLGAAFLLLEFQNISKTALLFGSTWAVSALTISAILLLILLANWIASRVRPNPRWMYVGLWLAILVAGAIPLRAYNALPEVWRMLAAVGVLNLPVGFAGVIFITSFQRTREPALAFGSNLLGAAVGGLLESLSFLTGIRALLWLAAALYLLAFASRDRL